MSLDVEGAEESVLLATDLSRIGVLLWEVANKPRSVNRRIRRLLSGAGLVQANLTIKEEWVGADKGNEIWVGADVHYVPYPPPPPPGRRFRGIPRHLYPLHVALGRALKWVGSTQASTG